MLPDPPHPRTLLNADRGGNSPPERLQGVLQMKYRKPGNTGLIVSEVALGTMQFGGKMNMGNLGLEDTTRMVKLALAV